MIVQNISGKNIKIPELQIIVSPGSEMLSLPYDIAFKYKKYFKPIQKSSVSAAPIIDKAAQKQDKKVLGLAAEFETSETPIVRATKTKAKTRTKYKKREA